MVWTGGCRAAESMGFWVTPTPTPTLTHGVVSDSGIDSGRGEGRGMEGSGGDGAVRDEALEERRGEERGGEGRGGKDRRGISNTFQGEGRREGVARCGGGGEVRGWEGMEGKDRIGEEYRTHFNAHSRHKKRNK